MTLTVGHNRGHVLVVTRVRDAHAICQANVVVNGQVSLYLVDTNKFFISKILDKTIIYRNNFKD